MAGDAAGGVERAVREEAASQVVALAGVGGDDPGRGAVADRLRNARAVADRVGTQPNQAVATTANQHAYGHTDRRTQPHARRYVDAYAVANQHAAATAAAHTHAIAYPDIGSTDLDLYADDTANTDGDPKW